MIAAVRRAWQTVARAWAEGRWDAEMHYRGYQEWRNRLATLGIPDVRRVDVLEIGCGERAQLSLLFAADGAHVKAIDILPVALGSKRPRMWIALARESGFERAIRHLARDAIHTARYWRTLGRITGRALPFRRVRVARGDAASLPYLDQSFDLVISSAVWEHLPDVQAATNEVARVLRPNGIAIIQIALFPALQGGHHAEWHSIHADQRRSIRPWDHLRGDHAPYPTYLNQWRESDYREVFDRALGVVDWADDELRGTSYLTPALRNELGSYTERDLLLSGITVWARPRSRTEP
jgi:SAM-dependent methyltransferase